MHSIPTEDHAALCLALEIQPHERVLEIGGGHNPVARAGILIDIDFDHGLHRDGQPLGRGIPGQCLVRGDVTALPFRDQSFDVVLCLHVLEHVGDPAAACREMMRVGGRGFIETPRKWTEYYAGHPAHLWLIDDADGSLVFEPIPYDDSPFQNFALPVLWSEPLIQEQVSIKNRNIPCVQFLWRDSFAFQVKGTYADMEKQRLANRHYHFARNLLWRLVPPQRILFHAKTAVELDPENARYCRLYAFLLALSGHLRQASRFGGDALLFWQAARFKASAVLSKRGERRCQRLMP